MVTLLIDENCRNFEFSSANYFGLFCNLWCLFSVSKAVLQKFSTNAIESISLWLNATKITLKKIWKHHVNETHLVVKNNSSCPRAVLADEQYGGWETSDLQKTLLKTMASSHHME